MRVLAIGRISRLTLSKTRIGQQWSARTAIGSDAGPIQFVTLNFWMHLSPMTAKLVRPYQLKVGRQVLNWGESTFVLGGNSVFNPIDVNALFVRVLRSRSSAPC